MVKTDIALSPSSDGVNIFKKRGTFTVWPIMVLNPNLPPSIRVMQENIIFVGFMPGPNDPKDIVTGKVRAWAPGVTGGSSRMRGVGVLPNRHLGFGSRGCLYLTGGIGVGVQVLGLGCAST